VNESEGTQNNIPKEKGQARVEQVAVRQGVGKTVASRLL
jgi:hypothetical protein